MSNNRQVSDEVDNLLFHFIEFGGIGDVLIMDAGDVRNDLRNGHTGIDECLVPFIDSILIKFDRRYLDGVVRDRVKAGSFEIESYIHRAAL